MGFGRGIWLPEWAFLLAVCCVHQIGGQIGNQTGSQFSGGLLRKQNASFRLSPNLNIIPPLLTNLAITPSNPAHNGRVCSTWGNFHFKTFDGDIFTFPGLCNYVFASHCNTPYEDFNIQIRREGVENTPAINRIMMKLEGVVVELTKDAVMINGNRVQLPYSQSGITIEKSSIYVKVGSKIGVLLLWNEKDSILLELNEKYANQTCGLCGDFNGFPIYNEFISNNIKMTALQFGNMHKMDGPTERCEDTTSIPTYNCSDNLDDICEKTLTSSAFAECNNLVDVKDYIKACQNDLCRSAESKTISCICDTFAEYSRQCAHAGGQPLDWRTSKLCPKKCPYNMQYQECNSPCTDTCGNPERSLFCEEHCIDGCFCPPGTVFDDINNSGCIPQQECSCIHNGKIYATGASFSEPCQTCTCNGGQWSCQDKSCPGTCSVVGGSHISTYDKKHYNHHGDCTYVLSKDCKDEKFTILVELLKCGQTDTETFLKSVTVIMNKGQTIVEVKPDGGVFVNSIYTQLPMSAANVTIFRPSSFFMIMDTSFGVQVEVQFIPMMQVFVRLDASFKNQTCGLCGNFNNIQTDDFRAISEIIEGTASAFANTWKTQASCPNILQSFENPCALSIDNEKYAQHWCGLLTDSTGPFAACHYAVNPNVYHTNCMFDTCNCENSEDCLCASLSSYVRACAEKGIQLQGWRADVCSKYTTSCPKSLSYSYNISSCQPTCRSLSEPDVTCNIKFVPVDGCTCVNGTYMDESGKCVPANECPCYYRGSPIQFGEVVHENGRVCTCVHGRLNCIGALNPTPVCESPMVYFDCKNTTAGTTGTECQKSCQTLDMQCYASQCTPGCVCPDGLVSDGNGGCIPEEECPCIHNEAMYQPGEKINFDCNTCVCKNRKWECTKDQCLGTCAVYGDGHYNTFDDKRFSFNGNCEYTLVQDHCGKSGTVNGTFRVITENIPCGNTGTTCSKSIKVFLEGYDMILGEEHVSVVKRGENDEVPYTVRYMGVYLVIETKSGLILMWDKKTSIFIKLSPDFKGQVCGLCGNYDGNSVNDFTTRSQSVVENVLEFGNSWKVSSTCPDASGVKDPCSTNPYRKSWSEKQCSIINSNVFAACHSQVEPAKYYQACVTDACACNTGGDCDCFCTAVAAYAQACSEVGVCIAWRSPSICPLFCDYYNQQGECEWHYKPCGASCMKTCKNPSGKCLNDLPGLEGCYPNCPPDKPYFHEDQMKCVSLCDCYDNEDGKIYKRDECKICECTSEGLQCKFDDKACNCIYEGKSYKYGELIYNTTDGTGWCFSATCDVNGTISRNIFKCDIFTTPFTFSTSQPTTTASEMTTARPVTTVCVKNVCEWSEWYDSTQPENKEDSGDNETFQNLKDKGYSVCANPSAVQCRAKEYPATEITNLNQTIECSQSRGLICKNQDQESKQCYNYEIRISCCRYIPCSEIKTPTTTTEFTTTAVESTPLTVQTRIKPTTQNQESELTTTPLRERTTTLTETSVTATTSQVSTTGYHITTTTPETSTMETQAPSSTTTISTLPESTLETTPGTKIITTTTAVQTQGTTVVRPTTRVPTPATTTASTSKTTMESTTTSTEKTLPTVLSTVAIQTTSTVTSSTPHTKIRTTTGTTALPSKTATPTEGTTIIATTTRTSPPLTEGTTTITPPTTTVPTPATTTVRISSTTENCMVEHCAWTQWFNVDSPTPGSENGDIETFESIRAAGYELCDKPRDIKCRTKDYPDQSVKITGQKFECSLDRGLVCRNKDQPLNYPTCFDYEVSVLCCERKNCQTTVPTPATTASTSTTYLQTETTTVATQPAATTTAVSTLPPQGTTKGTTTITPRPSVPTPATSTASTTRTTEGSTTTASTTPTPGETSTAATQAPTSPTTTSKVKSRTTTAATALPSTTTPPTEGTTIIATTTRTSPPLTEGTTTITPPTTTVPTPATTTVRISSTTENCMVEHCAWTQWFNVDSPTPGSENGDIETFESIRAAGYELCDKPRDIKCRTKDYPDQSVKITGQKFECSLDRGLVCRNKDQPLNYPTCFDYEVSVLCCERKNCQTTVPTPATTASTSTTYLQTETTTVATQPAATTTAVSTLPPQGTTKGTTTITPRPSVPTPATSTASTTRTTEGSTTTASTTPTPGETSTAATQAPTSPTTTSKVKSRTTTAATALPSTMTPPTEGTTIIATTTRTSPPLTEGTTTITPPTTTVPTPATTTVRISSTTENCMVEHCAWTQWFNVDSPTPGSENGDIETFESIRAAGYELCDKPRDIKCRTKDYPDQSVKITGQKFECSLDRGLVCRNKDQPLNYPTCFDYEVSVLCCERKNCQTTVPTPATTASTSTTYLQTETTTVATQPAATTTAVSTLPPQGTTKGTTTITPRPSVPTPATSTASTTRTTEGSTTTASTTPTPGETSTAATQAPTSPTTTSKVKSRTTTAATALPSTTTPPTEGTTIIATTTRTSPPLTEGTTTITPPTTTVPTPATTTVRISSTTENCMVEHCAWTQWFNVDSPTPGSENGDIETFESIRAAGYELCDKPRDIKCRTKDYPDQSVKITGQKFECSLDRGLVCRNKDQPLNYPTCFDYEVSVLCCERKNCQTTVPTPATTASTSTTYLQTETTTVATQPAATTTAVSTLPPQGTTKGTTTITPRPSVPTPATSTASTTRTTEGSTTTASTTPTPGETSTAATQAPTSPTTTSKVKSRTTTAATALPSTTTPPTEGTTIIATTTRTSPPLTEGTTTITPPTTTVPTPATTTVRISSTTENCMVEHCAWTQWFNVDSPTPGSENGDIETFESIRAAGYELCDKPRDIKCRTKDYPDQSVKITGQKFECSLDRGLVCRNKDQPLNYPTCFDYEVSVLCCERKNCQTTVPTPATTASTSTTYLQTETTTVATQPAATTTAVSTLPPQGTTKGTTTITPRPSVPTPATSTASTTRTTEGSTTTASTTPTPGETSTAATQAPTSPTTTSKVKSRTTTATTALPSTTTPPTEGTTIIATTTRTSPPLTEGTTTITPPTTTVPTPATTTLRISSTTENCMVEHCAWTQWFNVDSPTPGSENGDIETFESIRAAGYELCDKPRDIKCRAKDYPDKTLKIMGQKFECSLDRGLVCRNKDQPLKYPTCFDYEVSVLCCERKNCQTTVPTPATTASTSTTYLQTETTTVVTQPAATTTAVSTLPPQGTTKGTTTITPRPSVPTPATSTASTTRTTEGSTTTASTTPTPGETSTAATQAPTSPTTTSKVKSRTTTAATALPSTTTPPTEGTTIIATTTRTSPPLTEGTTTITPPTTTVPTPATTTVRISSTTENCMVEHCAWTQWFNVDSPTPGSENGDIETFESIRAAGYELCDKPRDIKCRTKDYPDQSVKITGQKFECSLDRGLVCRNKDQPLNYPTCFDYEVSVLCCERKNCQTTVPTPATTASTSTTYLQTETTTVVTQPAATTTAVSTLPPQGTTKGTTTITPRPSVPTPATSTASTTKTTEGSTTTTSTTPTPGETSTAATQAPTSPTTTSKVKSRTTTATTALPSTTTPPTEGTTIIATTTRTSPPLTEGTTTITPPTTTVPTPATTTVRISSTTENCMVEHCAWTQWFNVDSPTPGSENGDIETFESIRAAGYELCDKPRDIKCRTKDYPDQSVKITGQKFECSLDRGLVCRNKDQPLKYPTCFDYEVSVLCCERKNCQTTVPTPATTASTSTTYLQTETTTVATQPAATTTAVSTLPPQGTTKGTTTITPRPSVPTPATSTASTTRTTEGSTTTASTTPTPGETSTAATQAPTSPTTTSKVKSRTTTATTALPSTTTPPTEGTTIIATTTRTSPPLTEGTTTITAPTTTVPTPATTTVRISSTTENCMVEHCAWTQWFNVDSPTPGSENGDIETFESIRAAGYELCDKPRDIKCRTKDYPDQSVKITGQKFECSLDRGLVCRNKDQPLKYPTCFDYEVSVLCCERKNCQTTVPTPATTASTSTTYLQTETTTVATQPAATTTAVSTLPPQGTTKGTTTITPRPSVPTPATSTASTTRTTEGSTTTASTTPTPGETSTAATQAPTSPTTTSKVKSRTTTATTALPSTTTPPTEGTTIIATTTRTSPPLTEGTTTITPPTTTVPTPATTTVRISSTTENCMVEHCAWTQWFNVDSPTPGSENGDIETFESIRAAGYELCDKPRDIKCRTKDYPDQSVKITGQKFECSLDRGLVCRNKDQPLKYPTCFDYEVSVLCCERKNCQTTVPTPATTASTSTTYLQTETTTVATQPAATTTAVSTLPPQGTTKGTTTITPRPSVPTPATSTASTTRTTEGSTTTASTTPTPGETSTAATQAPTSPTTTSKVKSRTTTATTALPSTTTPPTEGTTIIATTTRTSPPLTEGTTTITPPTTTVPTPATTTVRISSTTENCMVEHCAWTQWFNVDSPTPGSENGDIETFESIRAAGYELCDKPRDIKCRTKDYPDQSVKITGQKFECSLDRGLVCRNKDQPLKYPTCFDYEVSVLCCERKNCQTTVPTPATTASTSTTYLQTETTTVATQPAATTTAVSTLPPQGTTKGTTTITPRPSVPTPATSTASTTRTTEGSTTTASTTPTPGETSTAATQAPTSPTTTSKVKSRTTTATTALPSTTTPPTEGTTIIATTTRTSPPLTEGTTTITPPTTTVPTPATTTVRISSTTENCMVEHCAWTQWFNVDSPTPGSENGDIETFESIRAAGYELCDKPRDIKCRAKDYPDKILKILGQKFECSLDRGLVCRNKDQPLKYPTCFDYEVSVLCCERKNCQTTVPTPATTASTSTTYLQTETTTVATQPAATTTAVSMLPQKGTTKETTTITPRPSVPTPATSTVSTTRTTEGSTTRASPTSAPGETSTAATQAPTSPTFASTSSEIKLGTTTGSTAVLTTTLPQPGSTTGTTEILTTSFSSTVEKIATTVSSSTTFSPVASTGTSQSSHVTRSTPATFSSSTSTSVTSSKITPCFCHVFETLFSPGEVVYNRTDRAGCNFYALCNEECEIDPFQGPCPFTTPVPSVASSTTPQAASPTTATTLTTSVERNCTDVNPPRKPGEEWINECQKCVCDSLTATVQCQPLPCQTAQQTICDLGFVPMPVLPPKDPCCPEFECQPIPGVCVINGTLYTVGKSVRIDSCKKCTCSSEKDPETNANIIHCETAPCETSCPLGYQYMLEEGECCGDCIEVACKVKLSNHTIQELKVNEILPLDQCSYYKCEKVEDQFVAVQTKKVCPQYDPEECDPDEVETTPDGCCKICKSKNCRPYSKKTVIHHADCESSEPVELSYCEGTCPGSSVYSVEANQMEHTCGCCQELGTQTREVTLTCRNGTSINYNYLYVENCQCVNACSSETSAESDSQNQQSVKYGSKQQQSVSTGSQWQLS